MEETVLTFGQEQLCDSRTKLTALAVGPNRRALENRPRVDPSSPVGDESS